MEKTVLWCCPSRATRRLDFRTKKLQMDSNVDLSRLSSYRGNILCANMSAKFSEKNKCSGVEVTLNNEFRRLKLMHLEEIPEPTFLIIFASRCPKLSL